MHEDDARTLGWEYTYYAKCGAKVKLERFGKGMYMHDLFVPKQHRRTGVASQLVLLSVDKALRHRAEYMWLKVGSSQAAKSFWARYGISNHGTLVDQRTCRYPYHV